MGIRSSLASGQRFSAEHHSAKCPGRHLPFDRVEARATSRPSSLTLLEKKNVFRIAWGRPGLAGNFLEAQQVWLRGDVEDRRSNLALRRALGEFRNGNGEVEQQIDAKLRRVVVEERTGWLVGAQPD